MIDGFIKVEWTSDEKVLHIIWLSCVKNQLDILDQIRFVVARIGVFFCVWSKTLGFLDVKKRTNTKMKQRILLAINLQEAKDSVTYSII